ncbi:ABC transporter ATP-binding protein [Mycoplasmopsis alligatoris]|uniref:ABC transporter, ATP-binding protein n=1 Tax=Mycoplasmopsis alligatoris A21JP2 TaxID=747682 RepID=D4XVY8_9BACT|nr:ABC transporter ATP-binding protein [Mycoplasmopsis alligatoris]EFF41490.1 ABC transporter, ATP-binding protein [Mycoplasmopsis alligatoris A21JP2]
MNKKYYCEKSPLGKKVCRLIKPGTDAMLNAYPQKNVLVSLRHLDINYGAGLKQFSAIKDLNLNIYEGEVLGLVGESGSGKSTTGRAIIGLTPHSFGYIKIKDRVIPKNINKGFSFSRKKSDILKYMISHVQMIFQDPTNSLNPYKNVEWVVSEGLLNSKNAAYLFQINFDQLVLSQANQISLEIDPSNPLVENELKAYRQAEKSLEDSYKLVFETLYNKAKKMHQENNVKYSKLLKFFDQSYDEKLKVKDASEKECKKMLIINMLKQVGLDETVLGRFPLEFSGGQQQRLGICRSIILKPKLLIADEPISALDVSIQAQVINIFKELKEKFHLTILFIAHDLRMVEYISDRIAVINKGVLLEIGTSKEIVKNAFHPYTKSLLDAVPSIESKKGSLLGYQYDSKIHTYDQEYQPKWIKLNKDHFVLATDEEYQTFANIHRKR